MRASVHFFEKRVHFGVHFSKKGKDQFSVGADRCTQLRTIDGKVEEVGTDRCIQLRTIDRKR